MGAAERGKSCSAARFRHNIVVRTCRRNQTCCRQTHFTGSKYTYIAFAAAGPAYKSFPLAGCKRRVEDKVEWGKGEGEKKGGKGKGKGREIKGEGEGWKGNGGVSVVVTRWT